MRNHDHEIDTVATGPPKANRIESENDALICRPTAARRTDVLGLTGLLGLQRAVGNAAVSKLVSGNRGGPVDNPTSGVIQVNNLSNPYAREVAANVDRGGAAGDSCCASCAVGKGCETTPTTTATSVTISRQATVPPGGPGGHDPCLDLLQTIIDFLNDVAKRINDALDDPHGLFEHHRRLKDAHPEHGSWDGHRDRYYYERGRLRQKLAEWDSNDDCRGFRLSRQQQEDLTEAREFGEKEFPERPARSLREGQEPEPSTRERIAESLRRAGVPAWAVAALVVLVIAALADPEPFSKVAALIGAAAAIAFFILIGRRDAVPGGGTTASAENVGGGAIGDTGQRPESIASADEMATSEARTT
jgi:hypothetical protein